MCVCALSTNRIYRVLIVVIIGSNLPIQELSDVMQYQGTTSYIISDLFVVYRAEVVLNCYASLHTNTDTYLAISFSSSLFTYTRLNTDKSFSGFSTMTLDAWLLQSTV